METYPSQNLVARRAALRTDVGTAPAREPFSLSYGGDLLVFLPCLIALGIGLLAWVNHLLAIRKQFSLLKRSQKFPCGRCRYFQNNPYLYCAVQPARVLQEEAKDCPDYSSHSSQADQQNARFSPSGCHDLHVIYYEQEQSEQTTLHRTCG